MYCVSASENFRKKLFLRLCNDYIHVYLWLCICFFCLLLLPYQKREGPVCCSGWLTRLNPCQLGAKVAHAESPAGPPCQLKWNLHSTRCTHADKSNVYQLRKSNVYQSRKSNDFVAKKLDAAALGGILWSLHIYNFFRLGI